MATVLSVNGVDGTTIAARRSTPREQRGQLWKARDNPLDEKHGHNAPRAMWGGRGGYLAVKLSKSSRAQGEIRVQCLACNSLRPIPLFTEVPSGENIVLTAIGGDGERGGEGGDGQDGRDGSDGVDATRASDATDGAEGGHGGNSRRGSNGGDGGSGETIHILVDENDTHLLMAVSSDVSGGKGGAPGKHGRTGLGGKGCKGGGSCERTFYKNTGLHGANGEGGWRIGGPLYRGASG